MEGRPREAQRDKSPAAPSRRPPARRDAALAHPHTPPLSTYDVQEPSCGLQELREMNGARTESPENAEDAEIQAGSVVEAPSARTSEDLR